NATTHTYSREATIDRLFETQVEKSPDSIAITGTAYGLRSKAQEADRAANPALPAALTYRELNRQARQLAQVLREKGVKNRHIVAISSPRTSEMIIGKLAILKAGAAYLPIDPNYPEERKKYMIKDSNVQTMLAAKAPGNKKNETLQTLYLEDIHRHQEKTTEKGTEHRYQTAMKSTHKPKDPVYVIYTSGSTGKPKGVLIRHESLVNFVGYHRDVFGETVGRRMSQVAGPGFDAMAFETWPCLTAGANLYIADDETRIDPAGMKKWLIKNEIHITFQPTVMAEQLLKEEWPGEGVKLRTLRTAGDRLNRYPERNYPFRFYNLYGPTEDTIWTTWTEVERKKDIKTFPHIGKPVGNARVYITGPENRLQPVGIAGEMCISGQGLAAGYLNRPELTMEKFVPNPYEDGELMYRTGDRARWLQGGNIEFLGRVDNQVQIRGFRVEPGEIENQLLMHHQIKEAVVAVRQKKEDEKYLCAYLVSNDTTPLPTAELRTYLEGTLPKYMIPSYFVNLAKLPLTPNGKVDRKALPPPPADGAGSYEAPADRVEQLITEIWAQVLDAKKENIGVNTDFFQLGGHSLKANTVITKIHKTLDVKVPLLQVFRTPTVRGLAHYINRHPGKGERYTTIEPAEKKEYYPLSPAQKRIFVLQDMQPDNTAYNMPQITHMEKNTAVEKLEETFRQLIKRHESFRTTFQIVAGTAVQRVHREVEFNLEHYRAQNREELQNIMENFVRPFKLDQAPLLHVALIETKDETDMLIIEIHHIIFDGSSHNILTNELFALHEGKELPPRQIHYKEYAQWRQTPGNKTNRHRQETFWLEEFKGEIPQLTMPTDYHRPGLRTFEGNSTYFEIGKSTAAAAKRIAGGEGITLYILFLAVYTIMLSKISGQEDVVTGTVVAGRRHLDLETIIGMFANTLPLRNYPTGTKPIRHFLREVRERTLKAFDNQDYPFEDLVEKVAVTRDTARNPLFDAMFAFQDRDMASKLQDKEQMTRQEPQTNPDRYYYENKTSKFDMTLHVIEKKENLLFTFEYSTRLFKKETIEKFIGYFKRITAFVTIPGNLNEPISEAEIISANEKQRLLYQLNPNEKKYPQDKTIHRLFEDAAARRPGATALEGPGLQENTGKIQLTYGELNRRSNLVAGRLREKGTAAGAVIPIMMEPSIEMITGLLAILKGGGAYLPLDPGLPADRLNYMMTDTAASVLLTTRGLENKISFKGEKIYLEEKNINPDNKKETEQRFFKEPGANASDPAYIIYTSGTTGKPKGTMIEHKNVVRLMVTDDYLFEFNGSDTWTLFHSFCFDFSVWEMYGALLYGGKLIVIPGQVARDPEDYLKQLKLQQVTVLNQTPQAFYNLTAEELKYQRNDLNLKYVIFGGEALAPAKLKEWKQKYPETKLINMFGITETTVHVTYKEIRQKEIQRDISNIGRPIPTLSTYVMDKYGKLLPEGIPGELCVGGEGLSRGYLNRPELTAEKFVKNPYKPGEMLYRSGDLARLTQNGEMEYMGRIDHQVKIRGYRIELGEIENHLLRCDKVNDAVVLHKRDENGGSYLCAYIVSLEELSPDRLRNNLAKTLPHYMIPAYFMTITNIPLTSNGKIDRKALPEPALKTGEDYTAPGNDIQKTLVGIWQDVLGLEKVGIGDNYFNVGGDSIKAIKLLNVINNELKSNLKIADLFVAETIEKLSARIEQTGRQGSGDAMLNARKEIDRLKHRIETNNRLPVEIEDVYPMSDIEKGMLFHSLRAPEMRLYHDQMVHQLKYKNFDPVRLKKALALLTRKHSILRTGFNMEDFEEPVQLVYKENRLDFEHYDISGTDKNGQEDYLKKIMAADREEPLNTAEPPLWRMKTFALGDDTIFLLWVCHHAIIDGWSDASFMTELNNTYLKLEEQPGYHPSKLANDYKQFIIEQLAEKNNEKTADYWKNKLEDYKRVEFAHGKNKDHDNPGIIKRFSCILDREMSEVKQAAKKYGTSLNNLCFAAYVYTISMLTYENDIVVGIVTNNRPLCEDSEKILGCFLNTVPVRIKIPAQIKWNRYVSLVNEEMAQQAKYNRLSLFEILRIAGEETKDKNPLFDTIFNFVDFHVYKNAESREQDTGEDAKPDTRLDVGGQVNTNTLLDISIDTTPGKIALTIAYENSIMEDCQVEKIGGYFMKILEKMITQPESTALKAEILSPGEKETLLYTINKTETDYPREKNLHQLFEETAAGNPERLALVGPSSTGETPLNTHQNVSYGHLNSLANRLARRLQERGAAADTIVAIMAESSLEMITGIFAVLKAGAAFLPLNPQHPGGRLSYLLDDSRAILLLTQTQYMTKIDDGLTFKGEVMDLQESRLYIGDDSNPVNNTSPEDNLYLIYTSGTTGKPKGVQLRHRNLVNYVDWFKNEAQLAPSDKTPLTSSYAFDLGYTSIFPSLLSGAQLHMLTKETYLSDRELLDYIEKNGITYMKMTPSLFTIIANSPDLSKSKCQSLRLVVLGGEAINLRDVARAYRICKHIRFMNEYGPTEATIGTIAT
ncbi:MAG: amino acid adenylation domain-containing protein, partial [bacterium]|nr:amino acid adenylation domain-containing protein [bacterium]